MKFPVALLFLLLFTAVWGKDTPPVVNEKPVVLEPFKVRDNAIISFAIDIVIYASPETRTVTHIVISRVRPGTDAERAGLQAGDEIVKLDGEPVKGLDPRVVKDSPLGKILLNRDPGEPLKLEIITHRTEHFVLHAQKGSELDRP